MKLTRGSDSLVNADEQRAASARLRIMKIVGITLVVISVMIIVAAGMKSTVVSVYNTVFVYSHDALEQENWLFIIGGFMFLGGLWFLWAS